MSTFLAEKYTPEQCRALAVVEEVTPIDNSTLRADVPSLTEICTTGARFIISGKISTSDLPRGSNWLWNQSRARSETTDTTGSIKLIFFKLNTRKSRSQVKSPYPPQLKVWVFVLDFGFGDICSVLWCERGFSDAAQVISQKKPSPGTKQKENAVDLDSITPIDPFFSDTSFILGNCAQHSCFDLMEMELKESSLFDDFINGVFMV